MVFVILRNNEVCRYDGDCTIMLFEDPENDYIELGNGNCNLKYNNPECNYDNCDCKPNTYYDHEDGCYSLVYNETVCNLTYHESKHDCNPEWVNDGWCDTNCQGTPQCGNDGDDCAEACATYCNQFMFVFARAASLIVDDGKISLNELCVVWPFLKEHIADQNISDCNNGFEISDTDNDGYVIFGEALITLREYWELSEQKVHQINCSAC